MKFIDKNLSKILNIFIIMQPILDALTAIFIHLFGLSITPGIIVRFVFLIFMIIITIYKNKKTLCYYIPCLIYFILYFISSLLYSNNIILELQGLFRVFYFPLLLVAFYNLKDEIKLNKNILITTLSLYIGFVAFPSLFGIGFKTYEVTKAGNLGLFNSANEISGIISILTPLMINYLYEKKNLYRIIYLIIYLYVILNVGTKTPLLALIITFMFILIWIIRKFIKEKKYRNLFYCFLITITLIILSIIIIPKTNFYKNIKTHLDFLEVDEISDLKNSEILDHFIFSSRIKFLREETLEYEKASKFEKFVGIGYINEDNLSKTVEMDYFDIYFSNGIIGFFLFFYPFVYIIISLIKIDTLDYKLYMKYLSIFLLLLLALFTGHIITTPSVSLIVIIILLELNNI